MSSSLRPDFDIIRAGLGSEAAELALTRIEGRHDSLVRAVSLLLTFIDPQGIKRHPPLTEARALLADAYGEDADAA